MSVIKSFYVVILLALIIILSRCYDDSSPSYVYDELEKYCIGEDQMICVATPYDCEICTGNAHKYIEDSGVLPSDVCYLVFSLKKRGSESEIKIGGKSFPLTYFYDKSIYDAIVSGTTQQKFPVIVTCHEGECEIHEF